MVYKIYSGYCPKLKAHTSIDVKFEEVYMCMSPSTQYKKMGFECENISDFNCNDCPIYDDSH